ncbi:hypothetical protein Pan161_27760 [Gimesia algae]|uniref:Uncharacterized protein n=1 Tax=Gimesia algae TaxID=2527971 RepID=A0A517VDN9_9PLAN|nr:hypothetical protein Pan161_27760 [Gimesia algae]
MVKCDARYNATEPAEPGSRVLWAHCGGRLSVKCMTGSPNAVAEACNQDLNSLIKAEWEPGAKCPGLFPSRQPRTEEDLQRDTREPEPAGGADRIPARIPMECNGILSMESIRNIRIVETGPCCSAASLPNCMRRGLVRQSISACVWSAVRSGLRSGCTLTSGRMGITGYEEMTLRTACCAAKQKYNCL